MKKGINELFWINSEFEEKYLMSLNPFYIWNNFKSFYDSSKFT
jgi:hypothetical protein